MPIAQPNAKVEIPVGISATKGGGSSYAALCVGMAAQFAAGGAVVPFVTILLRERGLDFAQTSQIFTISSATLLFFPFLWGMLADRIIPLNRLFLVLNLLACGSLGILATQRSFGGMLLGYCGYFACFNPSLYLINALCFHHLPRPREQFGGVRAWGSLGWIIPFLPISLWLARGDSVRFDFVLYLGMAFSLCMAGVSFWLPHTPPGGRGATAPTGSGPIGSAPLVPTQFREYLAAMRKLFTHTNYLVVVFSMFLMAGSFSLLTYYSPARLQEIGIPRPWIGPVQAIGVLFEIVLLQRQPALLRRWNFTALVLIGCAALAIRQFIFAMVDDGWILAGSYLLSGLVIVFYNQGASLLVNAMATAEVRATAQTVLLLCGQGLGPLFANAVTGSLARHGAVGLRPIFLFASLLSGAAALVILARGSALNQESRPLPG